VSGLATGGIPILIRDCEWDATQPMPALARGMFPGVWNPAFALTKPTNVGESCEAFVYVAAYVCAHPYGGI